MKEVVKFTQIRLGGVEMIEGDSVPSTFNISIIKADNREGIIDLSDIILYCASDELKAKVSNKKAKTTLVVNRQSGMKPNEDMIIFLCRNCRTNITKATMGTPAFVEKLNDKWFSASAYNMFGDLFYLDSFKNACEFLRTNSEVTSALYSDPRVKYRVQKSETMAKSVAVKLAQSGYLPLIYR